MTIATVNIDLFLLVFMRIMGTVIFNPIFGKTSVPTILKVAFSLICAFLITPVLHYTVPAINGPIQMIVSSALELSVGLIIGILINMMLAVVSIAGEAISMQMGLGMAMVYDPTSSNNVPVIGSLFNALMIIIFFAGNAHLSILSLLSDSFKAIAPGTVFPTSNSAIFLVNLGTDMYEFGLRMAIPVIAIELICIIGIAMMMKAVPQMNIFAIGIQLEAIVGIVMLLISVPVVVGLSDRLSSFIVEKTAELIRLMVH